MISDPKEAGRARQEGNWKGELVPGELGVRSDGNGKGDSVPRKVMGRSGGNEKGDSVPGEAGGRSRENGENGKNGFVRKKGEDFSERDYVFVSERRRGMGGWDEMGRKDVERKSEERRD